MRLKLEPIPEQANSLKRLLYGSAKTTTYTSPVQLSKRVDKVIIN
jgi:hypothetical protein